MAKGSRPKTSDSPLYDRALLLAMHLLTLVETEGDVPTPVMLGKFTFIILDELREARSQRPGFAQPSMN